MKPSTFRVLMILALLSWGVLTYMIAFPASAQTAPNALPDGVDLTVNCGTLKGHGTAVVRIYGRTFALLNIACERV